MKTLAIFALTAFALTACDNDSGGTATQDTGRTNPDGARAAKETQTQTGTPANPEAQRNTLGQ